MQTPPDGVDARVVAEAVRRGWGVRAERLAFDPRGFGGYHWRVAAAEGGAGVTAFAAFAAD